MNFEKSILQSKYFLTVLNFDRPHYDFECNQIIANHITEPLKLINQKKNCVNTSSDI